MMDDENTQVLNFKAKLISDYPEDRRRQFMVSFYLSDKTLAIFEIAVPNSGFRAGKFLQRTRIRNPLTKQFFEPGAFFVGAQVHVSGRVFELIDAAPHTFCLMEARADEFPEADITSVIEQLKGVAQTESKPIRQLFESKDPRKTGLVDLEEAKNILNGFVPKISKHAVITISRAFEQEGRFNYNTILGYLKA